MNVPYVSGTDSPPALPLGRFLPPIPKGMVRNWAAANLPMGTLILDPFGFNPLIAIELVESGYPVLVAANNPIHAFLLRTLASAPRESEFVATLQDLAIASKGETRMEPYIRSLYQINCADCKRQIEAEVFLWQKGGDRPYAAIVTCPHCGAQGEQALGAESGDPLSELPPLRLHQARALNRITGENDPLRTQVSNALNAYPARPLIILQTIINKLESLEQSPRRRELLIALILSAADQGNTLWPHPTPRERPRQIVVPSVYRERNLWKALEEAVKTWQTVKSLVPVMNWEGSIPPEPAITLYEGRLKELLPLLGDTPIPAVITAIPRPNQAFWTFSALWTGWIWGRDAITPIRQVLSRQRYDWNWHTNALKSLFATIHAISDPACRFWGLVAEDEPMLLLSASLAANAAGWQLASFAQSVDDEIAQCSYERRTDVPVVIQPTATLNIAREKISAYLREKGEPAEYEQVHAAVVTGLAHQNALAIDIFMQNENQFASETQKLLESLFEEPGFLKRVGDDTATLETGIWWLERPDDPEVSLIDRLEEIILQRLIDTDEISADDLKDAVYQELPGIFTPSHEDILNCLESYAELVMPDAALWKLRESDQPVIRQKDIQDIWEALTGIAQRLGFAAEGEQPLIWRDPAHEDEPVFSFQILTTALVRNAMQTQSIQAQRKILLIPGSRENLLAYKKQRDPVLKEALDREFIIVKFRLIRDLEANSLLSLDLFLEQIQVDPPEYQSSQLALF